VPSAPAASTGADPARPVSVPAPFVVLVSVASIAAGSGYAVPLIARVGPVPAVWLRVGIGTLILAIIRPFWRSPASGAAWRTAIVLGIALAAMNASYYASIGRIPLGVAVALEFWGPLAIGVLGSRRWLDLAWVALAAVAVFILTGGRLGADDAVGMAFAVIAGGFWAIYIVTAARLGREWPDGRGLGAAMLVATSLLVVPAVALGSDRLFQADVLAAGAVIALLGSVIPYSLQLATLRRLSTGAFGVLMSLDPAFSAAVGFVLLGQVLDAGQVVAIGLVVVASTGVSLSARGTAGAIAVPVEPG
jgi:inner membrane transporter RhtA